MAVNLLDFITSTNDTFATKAQNLARCWRLGMTSCKGENDLIAVGMYLKVLSTDLTDYNFTTTEIRSIIDSIVNIYNITNVTIEESDIITYITNTDINNVYIQNTYIDPEEYVVSYSGTGSFTVTVNHPFAKYGVTVIVTDTTGVRTRVEAGITETNENTVVVSFASDSTGTITIKP